jgi:Flp pilus assembly pilin Flp
MLGPIISILATSERGQDLMEYALLAGLLALALLGGGLLIAADPITNVVNGVAACIDFDSSTDCAV